MKGAAYRPRMTEGGSTVSGSPAIPDPATASAVALRRTDVTAGGRDLGRLLSLSDGVFAFALTLLVLSLVVPSTDIVHTNGELGAALQRDLPTFLGYGFCFVMIAIWWGIHNRTYQHIARYDGTLLALNMMLLAQVAVMPFVLSVYATYANGPFYFQYAVDLFAAIQISLGLTATLTWDYARRARLTTSEVPDAVTRYFARRGYLTAAVFALSIGISFYRVDWAEYSWVLVFVVQHFLARGGD